MTISYLGLLQADLSGISGDCVPREGGIDIGQAYESLQEFLITIKKSIRSDIRIRLEIAFLPYKASMWDSLESVWMAAAADPERTENYLIVGVTTRQYDKTRK